MSFKKEQTEVMREAVEVFGDESRFDLWFEESAELTKEVCKVKRGYGHPLAIAEEMADCKIMLAQLEIVFDNHQLVKEMVDGKLRRLARTIEEEKEKHGNGKMDQNCH